MDIAGKVQYLKCYRSLLGRVIPVPRSGQGYHRLPMVQPHGWFLQPIRESHWNCTSGLEILHQVNE